MDPNLLARLAAKSQTDTNLQQQLEGTGANAVEALAEVPPNLADQARHALSAFGPDDQAQLKQHLKSYVTTRQQLAQSIGQTAGAARAAGAPDLAKDLQTTGREANEPNPTASILDKGKYAGKFVLDALGVPAHAVRALTNPTGPSWEQTADPHQWEDALKKSAAEGSIPAKVFRGATNAVASIPAGLATGVAVGASKLLGRGGDKDAAKEMFSELQEKYGDFARETISDPTTFMSMGLGGEAGNASRVAERLAAKEGLKDAKLIGQNVGNIVKRGQTPETFANVAQSIGLPIAKTEEAFGKGGAFLGKGQLRVGLPGTDIGVDVLPALTGKEYLGGKALEAAYKPVRALAKSELGSNLRPLFDPTKEHLESAGRAVRGGIATTKNAGEKELDSIAKLAPVDRARRIEILQRHIDPGIKEVQGVQVPKDYLPYDQLSPSEQQWVDRIQEFFQDRHDELVNAGLLEQGQVGKNAATGQYYPRQDPGRVGLLDVRGKPAVEQLHPKPGFLNSRTGDIPVGDKLPTNFWEQRNLNKLDPNRVLSQYSRQSAEAVGRRRFEMAVAEQFGTTKPVPNWVSLQDANGVTKYVPPDIAEHVNATFDRTFTSVANMIRATGAADHPVGRALVAGLDVVKDLGEEFKRNVTSKVPGFHVVNALNDVSQMQAVAGVNNPIKWFKRADEVLKAKTPQAQALRELAMSHNVATEADAAVGQRGRDFLAGGRRAVNDLNRKALEGAAERGEATLGQQAKLRAGQAYHAVDTLGDRFGNFWRSRAELATFLARLDKGDSPQTAAKFVAGALLDYGSPNRATQALTTAFPFAKFLTKAPVMAAKGAIRNPGVVNLQHRAVHAAIGSDEQGFDPKQNVKERGPYEQLTEGGKGVASSLWNAMLTPERAAGALSDNAGTIRPGYGATVNTRLPIEESFAPYDVSLPGNESMAQALNPLLKAAYENRSGQDLLTKQPLKLDPTLGMAGKYLAPALLSPITMNAVNTALYWMGGGPNGGSLNRLGAMRDYSSDPAQQRAAERLNLLTRIPVTLTDPTVALDAARRKAQAAVDPARQVVGTTKKTLRQTRKK